MELKRVGKAVASRWVVVVAISILGVVAALVVTDLNNRNATAIWEATAAIAFEPEEGETIADLGEEIQSARDFAAIAAEDLLAVDPDLLIVANLAEGRLEFIAEGATQAEAGTKARALLQSFLETDPNLGEPVSGLIDQLEQDAVEIQRQIEGLQPTLTPEEEQLIDDHAFLDEQIQLIRGTLINLVIDESAADAEGRAAIEAQRSFLRARMQELEDQKEALPDPPDQELSVDDQLLLTTLERRMEQITARYEQLYLRQLGVTGSGEVEPVTFANLTPGPSDPVVNASIGFIGGLLIAIFAVSFLTRTRQTVWLRGDVAVPVLGEVPGRRVGHNVADEWYDNAEPGPRKTAIQALRSVVEAQVPPTGTTIGLTRHETPDDGARTLAADLAASMATAGKSVLLIDADFGAETEIGRFKAGGASVSGVLKLDAAAPEFRAEIQHATDSAYLVRPGLAVIPSGPAPESPADRLAGPQFRELVAAAREHYDIVIVAVDDLSEPAARVPLQRLDFGVVAVTPGKTTMPDLNGLLEDSHRLRITMLGAVFISQPERFFSFFSQRGKGKTKETKSRSSKSAGAARELQDVEEPSPSPISRLQSYPAADNQRTSAGQLRSLTDEIGRESPFRAESESGPSIERDDRGALPEPGLARTPGPEVEPQPGEPGDIGASALGQELLDALSSSSEAQAAAAVANYLVTRTEDMMTGRYGFGDYSEELVKAVTEDGFVPLSPLKERRTVSSWLKLEIEREADERTAASIIEEMERVISADRPTPASIDDWLAEEFFRRHLSRTNNQPTVWHLTSPHRSIEILVPAARLTRGRVEQLIEDVARVKLDELTRFRDAATTRGDIEQADSYDRRVDDVREFKTALETVVYGREGEGDDPEIKAWIPDWSLGVRANLALFQRAGLLPFPALSEDEVASIPASV
jgi:Mrp family chromosome partitioning ATPase